MLTKRETIGKGCPGREWPGIRENLSVTWLEILGFMVMGLASGLSLANHSDSGSFLAAHALLSQSGFQRGGFWKVGRTYGLESLPSF